VQVCGCDADPELLAICRAKGFAVDLRQHDLLATPWPYAARSFDHILACGVLHFLRDLAPVFGEVARLLRPGGTFTFTTKAPPASHDDAHALHQPHEETIQGTRLYLHSAASVAQWMAAAGLELRKELWLLVKTGRDSDELFCVFVTQSTGVSG
jgi:SAM-dependent methyltransferase